MVCVVRKLRIKRIRGKLSQSQFAEWLGIPKVTLQEWERGRHGMSAAAIALLKFVESGALKKPKR